MKPFEFLGISVALLQQNVANDGGNVDDEVLELWHRLADRIEETHEAGDIISCDAVAAFIETSGAPPRVKAAAHRYAMGDMEKSPAALPCFAIAGRQDPSDDAWEVFVDGVHRPYYIYAPFGVTSREHPDEHRPEWICEASDAFLLVG